MSEFKRLPYGKAKITKGYNLPCDYVIHTVGPRWIGGDHGEPEDLASCYKHSLEVAAENKIRSVAFPSISTGVYGYPVKEVAEIAIKTVKEYIEANPDQFDLVEWVLFDDKTYGSYEEALSGIFLNVYACEQSIL